MCPIVLGYQLLHIVFSFWLFQVKLPEGLEMLKIFKNYEADTSILDDFTYYDEREKSLVEKKSKQRPLPPGSAGADTISQLADSLAGTLNLEGNKKLPW